MDVLAQHVERCGDQANGSRKNKSSAHCLTGWQPGDEHEGRNGKAAATNSR